MVVEAIADHEGVGDLEAAISDGVVYDAADGLVEERTDGASRGGASDEG